MKSIHILILSLSVILFSCESLIIKDLELDDTGFEKQLAIQSILDIGTDSMIALVSENISVLDDIEDVKFLDADVSLLKEGTTIANLEKGFDGRYYHFFENGDLMSPGEYELLIENSPYGSSRTKTVVPVATEIKDLNFKYDAGTDPLEMTEVSEISFTIVDPPGENFYSVTLEGVFGGFDTLTFEGTTDTFYVERGVYVYPTLQLDPVATPATYSSDIYISDETFDGKEYTVTLRYVISPSYSTGNKEEEAEYVRELLRLKFIDHSEDSFNYTTSLDLYRNSQDFGLFSEPVSVYTNIDNGLGIFAGSNSTLHLFE